MNTMPEFDLYSSTAGGIIIPMTKINDSSFLQRHCHLKEKGDYREMLVLVNGLFLSSHSSLDIIIQLLEDVICLNSC